jgi:hypothetical protein
MSMTGYRRPGPLVDALEKIASVETRPQDKLTWPGKGLVGCKATAQEALKLYERGR